MVITIAYTRNKPCFVVYVMLLLFMVQICYLLSASLNTLKVVNINTSVCMPVFVRFQLLNPLTVLCETSYGRCPRLPSVRIVFLLKADCFTLRVAADFPGTLPDLYQTIRHHIPERSVLHNVRNTACTCQLAELSSCRPVPTKCQLPRIYRNKQ
jgi:hypothetical protein